MVHILKQKGALLCALLILLTALPLTAQRKRRAIAPLPALPDTVYLLDHYQESRHWMRDPDKISRAKAKRNGKEIINAGWEFLAPAWRGVQDSAAIQLSATTMLHLMTNFIRVPIRVSLPSM